MEEMLVEMQQEPASLDAWLPMASVLADDFKNAIQAVAPVVGQSSLRVLNGLCLQFSGDSLSVAGTDLTVAVKFRVDAMVSEPFETVADARLLREYVGKLGSGERCEFVYHRSVLQIRAGSVADLRCMPASEFPLIQTPEGRVTTFPAEIIAASLKLVAKAAAPPGSARPMLEVVQAKVIKDSGAVRLASVDGFRVHSATVVPSGPVGFEEILVPEAAAKLVAAVYSKLRSRPEHVILEVSDRYAVWYMGDGLVTSVLVDAQFPGVDRITPGPEALGFRVRVGAAVFRTAVEQARVFAEVITGNTKRIEKVVFTLFAGDKDDWYLKLETSDPARGTCETVLPVVMEVDNLSNGATKATALFGLNASYVLDVLPDDDGDEVVMDLEKPAEKPLVVFRHAMREDFLGLVMQLAL